MTLAQEGRVYDAWCYSRDSWGHNALGCCAGVGDHAVNVYCRCCPDEPKPAIPKPCAEAGCKCVGQPCRKCDRGEHSR